VSYVAEPYAQFVEDLLSGLTGGQTREQFRFLPEEAPYRLVAPGAIVPTTIRVFGVADNSFRRFLPDRDFTFDTGTSTVVWRSASEGGPAPQAVWPDAGSAFYVNFEYQHGVEAAPLLTDRNPGSITFLLSASFAREYAVLSKQLEAVYQSAFLDTATGRDLDQLVALVGLVRRTASFATGVVVFSRSSPAGGDITIPAGVRLSTAQPPSAVFETVEEQTLRRGNFSVDAAVQALDTGSAGIVPANAITVIHQPILGIESVSNPQPTRFIGETESDEALRARARRALEAAGRATPGAIIGALTGLAGLREKDIRLDEDPLAHPGIVKISVALPPLQDDSEKQAVIREAVERIEESRPAGVRVLTNIDAPAPVGSASPGSGIVPDEGGPPVTSGVVETGELFLFVDVNVQLAPTTLGLTPQERTDLVARGRQTVEAFIGEAGIGEALVYNRLVAQLMQIPGVLDVVLEMFPQGDSTTYRRKNVIPDNPAVRPVAGTIDVQLGGALVGLDVTVSITLKGTALLGLPETEKAKALLDIETRLRDQLDPPPFDTLSVNGLLAILGGAETYDIATLHYRAEYVEAGVRINQQDVELTLSGLEQLWIRRVTLADGEIS